MATSSTIPSTLFEKYAKEREYLYLFVDEARKAKTTLIAGQAQSYSLGNRSVTAFDIDKLDNSIDRALARIDEIEGLMCGRSARNVQTHSYASPAICIPSSDVFGGW